jgi:hypothetical protein
METGTARLEATEWAPYDAARLLQRTSMKTLKAQARGSSENRPHDIWTGLMET